MHIEKDFEDGETEKNNQLNNIENNNSNEINNNICDSKEPILNYEKEKLNESEEIKNYIGDYMIDMDEDVVIGHVFSSKTMHMINQKKL